MAHMGGYGRRRVPAGSPRMRAAQSRAVEAKMGKMGGAESAAERERKKRQRMIFAPLAGQPPFQR